MKTLNQFQRGTIVQQNQEYGIVTQINSNSDRPITITWDSQPDDPFAYTLDEINVLKICPLPSYHPHQTLVKLPNKHQLTLLSGELIQLEQSATFLVESVDKEQITVSVNDKVYQFPADNFPGIPFANLIQLPNQKDNPDFALSFLSLKIKAEVWLSINTPPQFLEIVTPAWERQLKQQFSSKITDFYAQEDFDSSWTVAWDQFLKKKAEEEGLYHLKINQQVMQKKSNLPHLLGRIQSIDRSSERPLQIIWEEGESCNYSLLELKALNIVPLSPLIQLSSHVAYQVSEDGSYFRAYIGFRTKKLAQTWLKPIKSLVGRLSSLHRYELENLRHLPDKIWEYEVEKFKYKTLVKKLDSLQKIAQLDLEKLP